MWRLRVAPHYYARLLSLAALAMLVVAVSVVSARPGRLAAASITVTSSVQMAFPTSITFNVKAQSDVNVTSLRLHYIVHRQSTVRVVSEAWPQFTPSPSVTSQWVWDMRKSSIPVGTQVEYWWTASDAGGKIGQTDHATVSFDDTRHQWQSIATGPVTLLWYNGDRAFADALLNAAQQGLGRIQNDTGATPQGRVRIFIYASAQELQGAMMFPQKWEGGATFQGYDVIAIGVPTTQLDYGKRVVPHELTHWIVGQLTLNDYGAGLPTWLEEGLATYGEGVISPDYSSALKAAIDGNKLISVRSLSGPFSPITEQAYISYGESNSIATFLIKTYGKEKMVELLKVFQQGATYDDALKQVYGFDQDGLDGRWRQAIGATGSR